MLIISIPKINEKQVNMLEKNALASTRISPHSVCPAMLTDHTWGGKNNGKALLLRETEIYHARPLKDQKTTIAMPA